VSAEATGNLTNVALGTCRASDLSKIVSIVSDAPAGGYPVGTTIVTWSATDALGNVGTGIQKVTIADTTLPVIRAPSDVATDAINGNPAIATLGMATVTDIFAVTVSNDAPATYSVGTTTVTWTAVDANGNTASATQRVFVALLDTLPPVVTAPPDVFATSSGGNTAVNLGAASANDNIDGMVAVSSNAPAAFPTGVTIVTYTAADAAGNTGTAVQRVIVSYLPIAGGGGGGTVITQPPVPGGGATAVAESVYWHHNDHLGTPQALTDVSGRKVWEMSQTPFGVAMVNEDPDGDGITVTNNFRFPGQYFDAETGLNYNYFRTYDPLLGRYTQSDPIGLQGGMNTFGYVNGNPIKDIDPMGLSGFDVMMHGGMSSAQAQGLSAVQQVSSNGALWNSLSPSERKRLQAEFGSNLANQSAMAGSMCALSGNVEGVFVSAGLFVLGKGIQYQAEPPSFSQALFDVSSTLLTTALPAKAAVIAAPALTAVDGVTTK